MINIALLGLGRIGIMHGKNLMRNKAFNLKYVYELIRNTFFCNSGFLPIRLIPIRTTSILSGSPTGCHDPKIVKI